MFILVSPPTAESVGLEPVAVFVILKLFTAEAFKSNSSISFPFESAINPKSAKRGAVNVLLVKVSEPASVASVPVVGSVTFVAPVVVRVNVLAPEVENPPAREIEAP